MAITESESDHGQREPKRLRMNPAAEYLGITARQLRNLKDRGLLAYYMIGGLTFFDRAELDRFLESCRHPIAS